MGGKQSLVVADESWRTLLWDHLHRNAFVERTIQSVQHQVRVLKLTLEDKWKTKIPHKHSVVAWIIKYSAFLLNRFEVGHDSKTANERLKGKKAKVPGIRRIGELEDEACTRSAREA